MESLFKEHLKKTPLPATSHTVKSDPNWSPQVITDQQQGDQKMQPIPEAVNRFV